MEFVSNSERIKNYAKRFSQGQWTFLGPADEQKWYGTLPYTPEGKWDSLQPLKIMVERFKDTGHPVFKSISAVSRGILKQKNGRDTIHFCGALSNWCEQVGLTEEEKGQEKQKGAVTKGVPTSVKSQEVKLWVSSPRLASGNSLLGNIQDFESLSETIRFTRVCELASFRYRYHMVNPDLSGTTVFGQIILLCREHTHTHTRFLE